VVKLPDSPVKQVALALVNRGDCYRRKGDNDKAIADYSEVIKLDGVPPEAADKARRRELVREPAKAIGEP
jgi:hypothetical protein